VLRFDSRSLPKGEHVQHGVWYGASTPCAALGEAYQVDRTIDRERGRPYLTGLSFARPRKVLDLAADSQGAWATAGGTFAISTAPHTVTQAFPDLDGLRYNSRFAGEPCLALFAPAASPALRNVSAAAWFDRRRGGDSRLAAAASQRRVPVEWINSDRIVAFKDETEK